MVQATFVVGRPDMEKIKERILTLSKKIFRSELGLMYLSPYVPTCAHIWVCLTKIRFSMTKRSVGKNPHYFGFIAGGITRLGYPVTDMYLGNCVSFGRSVARGDELVGENGIVVAEKAIGDTIGIRGGCSAVDVVRRAVRQNYVILFDFCAHFQSFQMPCLEEEKTITKCLNPKPEVPKPKVPKPIIPYPKEPKSTKIEPQK